MSHIESYSPRNIAAMAVMIASLAGPVAADSVMATQANVQFANISLSTPASRECWARYASGTGRTNDNIIEEVAFRVPCPEQMDQGFMNALQRSLAARGFFSGQVSGRADAETRAAVQAFQRANGFNSPILTLKTAQHLGLVPIERY